MAENITSFRMFLANCTGNAQNNTYRESVTITNAKDLAAACQKDHVCAAFHNCHRKNENYIRGYAFAADCDNDFTEDPTKWITPETVAERLPGVAFYAVKSRNCDKVKHPGKQNEKSARPRYHYYFPLIVPVEGFEAARQLTDLFLYMFPMFDDNGTKPAQFFYGHSEPVAEYHPGEIDIAEYFRENPIVIEPEPEDSIEPTTHTMPSVSEDFAALNVYDLLSYIPASCDYRTWYKVGMAIKAAGLPFEIWDDWSRPAPELYPGTENMRRKWLSFKGGRITFGTLVYLATENGWHADPEKLTGKYKEAHDAAGDRVIGWDDVISDDKEQAAPDKDQPIPGKTVITTEGATDPPKKGNSIPDLITYDADYFNNTDIPEPEPIIDQILFPGLGMLGAPAKMGKTYMVLQLGCCVVTGQPFMGFNVLRSGPVLYLDLQGALARTKKRLRDIGYQKMPTGLSLTYEARATDSGLIAQLERWITTRTQPPVLIIIDMLQQVKGSQRRTEDSYTADNRILEPLHDLALKYNLSILCVMHTRKGNKILPDDDPFNEIIGSIAQFGSADCAWMIIGRRTDDRKRFSVICRDNDSGQMDFEATFRNYKWKIEGTVEDRQEEREVYQYNHNPIVFTIRKLVEESPAGWIGNMSDLMKEVSAKTSEYPASTPEGMRKCIDNIQYRLSCEDIIIKCLNPNGGKRGRRYKIYQKEPEQQHFEY